MIKSACRRRPTPRRSAYTLIEHSEGETRCGRDPLTKSAAQTLGGLRALTAQGRLDPHRSGLPNGWWSTLGGPAPNNESIDAEQDQWSDDCDDPGLKIPECLKAASEEAAAKVAADDSADDP